MRQILTSCSLSLVFIFYMQLLSAQNGRERILEDLPKIKKTTLLVVLDEVDEVYNEAIKEAIESYWKFMPYKFVSKDELHTLAFDDQYSMLVRNNAKRVVHRVGRTDHIQSNHLAIYQCSRGDNLMNYTGRDALAQYHFKDVMDSDDYGYKLIALLQSMHRYIVWLDKNEITEDNHSKLLEKFCNEHTAKLSGMTLYVTEEDLSEKINDLEKLKKAYQHEIEIVDKATIQEAISKQKADVAFLHIDPRVKNIYILSAQGGEIIYHARTHEWGILKGKDFSNLSKAIEK